MKLIFLGTRGNLKVRSRWHSRHSSLLLSHRRRRVMIDYGEDWTGKLDSIAPHAILITHAHPDHAFGLKSGAACPIYATEESWRGLAQFPVADARIVLPRTPFGIGSITVEAFPVVHSIIAPAVGYRIRAGRATIFYVPDLIDIIDRKEALSGLRLYIGDGASPTRPIVRRKGEQKFGHTTIRNQLDWCEQAGVKRAIFTHCGSQIVAGDEEAREAEVRDMGRRRGIDASLAHDGMELVIRQDILQRPASAPRR